jgi:hypothetical protein
VLQAGASIGHISLVQNVLAKWRRFWSGVSRGLLSKEQQFGLFGELWFFCRWQQHRRLIAVGLQRAKQYQPNIASEDTISATGSKFSAT